MANLMDGQRFVSPLFRRCWFQFSGSQSSSELIYVQKHPLRSIEER